MSKEKSSKMIHNLVTQIFILLSDVKDKTLLQITLLYTFGGQYFY